MSGKLKRCKSQIICISGNQLTTCGNEEGHTGNHFGACTAIEAARYGWHTWNDTDPRRFIRLKGVVFDED